MGSGRVSGVEWWRALVWSGGEWWSLWWGVMESFWWRVVESLVGSDGEILVESGGVSGGEW